MSKTKSKVEGKTTMRTREYDKKIEQVIGVGHGGNLTTRISASIAPIDEEGNVIGPSKELFNREGHSYTQGFMRTLYAQMMQAHTPGSGSIDPWPDLAEAPVEGLPIITTGSTANFSAVIDSFTTLGSPGVPARVFITAASSDTLNGLNFQVTGITFDGGTPSVTLPDGAHVYLDYITTDTFALYSGFTIGGGFTGPIDLSGDGTAYDANSANIWCQTDPTNPTTNTEYSSSYRANILAADPDSFSFPLVYLGLKNTAVNVQDNNLKAWDIATWTGKQGQIRDQPQVDPEVSYIRFTRDFQNNSGDSVSIEELGLFSENMTSTATPSILLARDLQTIIIPHLSQVSLNFDIETNIDTALSTNFGGITQWFNELLYRHTSQVARNIQDKDNDPHSAAADNNTLGVASGAYVEPMDIAAGGYLGPWIGNTYPLQTHWYGPVVGRDDSGITAIAQDNYTLGDLVNPGYLEGELVYGASYVHDFEVRPNSWGSITLTAGSGGGAATVTGITVNSIQVMSGTVAFNTSLTQTALDIAANINAHTSSPNYYASAVGRTVTIKAYYGDPLADTFVVAPAVGGDMTASKVDMDLGNTCDFKVTRLFENKGGEPIEIKEIGCFANAHDTYNGSAGSTLICRYIHDNAGGRPPTTTVDGDEILQVTLTFRASG